MPVSPDKLALYPGGSIKSPEWLAIRARIQARAGDCCEQCGVGNGLIGIRLLDGSFMETPGYKVGDVCRLIITRTPLGPRSGIHFDAGSTGCFDVPFKVFKIVCTVAHVDGEIVDHSDDNLRFWCQKCHNSHDAPARAKNAAATRKARKPVTLLDFMGVA